MVLSKNKTYLSFNIIGLPPDEVKVSVTIAVGHSILVIAYHILKRKELYNEIDANYFDNRKKDSIVKNAIKKPESLGYKVNLKSIV